MSTAITIRLEPDVKQRFDHPAEATHRSKSLLAARPIRDLVDLNEWQIQETRSAVVEADNDDFASEDLVRVVLGKWGIDAG